MALWHPAKNAKPKQSEQDYAQMGALIGEMMKAGVLVDTGGWDPSSPSLVLTNTGGTVTVTDGPFAEAKEVIAGFAIMEAKSKEELIQWSKRFLELAGEGYSEVRELPGPSLR
jgi:hypothetical protein